MNRLYKANESRDPRDNTRDQIDTHLPANKYHLRKGVKQ